MGHTFETTLSRERHEPAIRFTSHPDHMFPSVDPEPEHLSTEKELLSFDSQQEAMAQVRTFLAEREARKKQETRLQLEKELESLEYELEPMREAQARLREATQELERVAAEERQAREFEQELRDGLAEVPESDWPHTIRERISRLQERQQVLNGELLIVGTELNEANVHAPDKQQIMELETRIQQLREQLITNEGN